VIRFYEGIGLITVFYVMFTICSVQSELLGAHPFELFWLMLARFSLDFLSRSSTSDLQQ